MSVYIARTQNGMLEVEPTPKKDMIEVSSSLQKTQIQTDHIFLIIVVHIVIMYAKLYNKSTKFHNLTAIGVVLF